MRVMRVSARVHSGCNKRPFCAAFSPFTQFFQNDIGCNCSQRARSDKIGAREPITEQP